MPLESAAEPPRHTPVLRDRCIELLLPALTGPSPVLLDATLGLGGHTEALLTAAPGLHVVAIDRDREALESARERLERAGVAPRATLVHAVYDEIGSVLETLGIGFLDGVLMDLGVSSMQLDDARRGFSYSVDAPLDMRMDPRDHDRPTAADILATYSAADLERVLATYGEERFARRIAGAIVGRRETTPMATSGELVALLRESVPAFSQRSGGHPAKRTFQALRIEVNGELAALEAAVPVALETLRIGGRIVGMSYQSLEDRIVKRAFAAGAASHTPLDLPVELAGHGPELRLLVRGAERASQDEQNLNPRSIPVRLRAAERIRAPRRAA